MDKLLSSGINIKPTGLYMAIDYHPWSEKTINLICKDLGIIPDNGPTYDYDPDGLKYHTTICFMKFTKENPKTIEKMMAFTNINGSTMFVPAKPRRPKIQVPVKILGFGFFDTPDGRNLHIKVSSRFLDSEFKRAESYGVKYGFPKYIPHITLKDSVPKDFVIPKEIENKYKGSTLYSNDEYIEPIN